MKLYTHDCILNNPMQNFMERPKPALNYNETFTMTYNYWMITHKVTISLKVYNDNTPSSTTTDSATTFAKGGVHWTFHAELLKSTHDRKVVKLQKLFHSNVNRLLPKRPKWRESYYGSPTQSYYGRETSVMTLHYTSMWPQLQRKAMEIWHRETAPADTRNEESTHWIMNTWTCDRSWIENILAYFRLHGKACKLHWRCTMMTTHSRRTTEQPGMIPVP